MFDLSMRRALVTGASGAIGSAIARALHASGAQVVLSGTRETALKALAGELGERTAIAEADLSEAAEVGELVGRATDAMGGIDILINNAGVTRDNLAMRMKDEEWQSVLDINLTACFRLSRAALRPMMKQRWGRIIGITSVVGVTGNPGQANYAAAKAGMIGMSKALAQEVASRGITVNCVAPGFVESPMTETLTDEQREKMAGAIPIGRFGTADDIASSVVYLASSEAAYVTGQTLHVNGGMAMI